MLYFVEVEDEVQLADVPEVLIEYFYEHLHELEHNELVVVLVDDCDEVETGVSLVDDFVFLVVQEVAHLGVTRNYQLIHLDYTWPTSLRIRCFSD